MLVLLTIVTLPLAAFSVQAPIISSSISPGFVEEDHLTQLKRTSNAHKELLTHFNQQLTDSQHEIDLLRGQIQETKYQLDKVVEQQKKILLQLRNISECIGTKQSSENNQNRREIIASSSSENNDSRRGIAILQRDFDDNEDYQKAISLVQNKSKLDEAITLFQYFLKKYPNSIYQANANYWLGQLNYRKGKKEEAVFYFSSVVKNYPKSPKAPASMFKVGVIMQEKGDKEKAKAVYQEVVRKYPEADIAIQAQKYLNLMK